MGVTIHIKEDEGVGGRDWREGTEWRNHPLGKGGQTHLAFALGNGTCCQPAGKPVSTPFIQGFTLAPWEVLKMDAGLDAEY